MIKVDIKKLSENAVLPTKNDLGDAAYDLYSTEDYILKPLERHLFKTNISIAIPEGYWGEIKDRSGKAWKEGLHVMGGVIDSTYRGDIGIVLLNTNNPTLATLSFMNLMTRGEYEEAQKIIRQGIEIKKGDKIAQIVFQKYENFEWFEVDSLSETKRGETGWGASGR